MRFAQLLLEYDREKTAQNWGPKLLAAAKRDTSLATVLGTLRQVDFNQEKKEVLLGWILKILEEADPTKHKSYVQTLAKMYANGNTKLEDISSRGATALIKYDTWKRKRVLPPEAADIGRFKSFHDFEDFVFKFKAPEEKQEVDKGTAKEYYNDNDIRIIIPEDKAAACYYGQGTKWCTAASKTHNPFDQYAEKGPLYIIIPKHPQHQGEKYQFHFEAGQFMNEEDKNVSLIVLRKRWPQLTKIFKEQAEKNKILGLTVTDKQIEVAEQALPFVFEQFQKLMTTEGTMQRKQMYDEVVHEILSAPLAREQNRVVLFPKSLAEKFARMYMNAWKLEFPKYMESLSQFINPEVLLSPEAGESEAMELFESVLTMLNDNKLLNETMDWFGEQIEHYLAEHAKETYNNNLYQDIWYDIYHNVAAVTGSAIRKTLRQVNYNVITSFK